MMKSTLLQHPRFIIPPPEEMDSNPLLKLEMTEGIVLEMAEMHLVILKLDILVMATLEVHPRVFKFEETHNLIVDKRHEKMVTPMIVMDATITVLFRQDMNVSPMEALLL